MATFSGPTFGHTEFVGDKVLSRSPRREQQRADLEALVRRVHRRRDERVGAVAGGKKYFEGDDVKVATHLRLERDATVRPAVVPKLLRDVGPSR